MRQDCLLLPTVQIIPSRWNTAYSFYSRVSLHNATDRARDSTASFCRSLDFSFRNPRSCSDRRKRKRKTRKKGAKCMKPGRGSEGIWRNVKVIRARSWFRQTNVSVRSPTKGTPWAYFESHRRIKLIVQGRCGSTGHHPGRKMPLTIISL